MADGSGLGLGWVFLLIALALPTTVMLTWLLESLHLL